MAETGAEPLDGIRILDLTNVIMGPFAAHILADLGADVIKVEAPEGDLLRHLKPYRHPGMGGAFLHLHRNKRGIVLDLKREAGRAALARLIETADVFLHSLRAKAMARLGFDYQAVAAIKPEIVYCAAYGFGAGGPYADKPAYDDVIQAGSGLAALYGRRYGTPDYAPTVVCDKVAGQAIAYAVLAGLLRRERGGGGQAIEVPMFETNIEFLTPEHYGGAVFDPPLSEFGYFRVLTRNRRPFPTADGHACIMPYSDRNWRDFFTFVGRPELADDPRFTSIPTRAENVDDLYAIVTEAAPAHSTAEWVTFCDRVSIPCMPVLDFEDLPEDRHVKAVGLFETVEHPTEGRTHMVRRPVNFAGSPFRLRRHAPRLGEHTREVLAEAGLSADEIDRVVADAVAPDQRLPGDEV